MCHLFGLVASHLTGLHTSWITPSHPAYFCYLFFFFRSDSSCVFSAGGLRSCRPQLDTREVLIFVRRRFFFFFCFFFSVLSLQTAGLSGLL